MKTRKTMDLTNGPIMRKLIIFAMPILLSNLLQHLYHAADKAVVGQFAGTAALAAVGVPGSMISTILGLFTGLAVGANIVCANFRGAQKQDHLQRSMHTGILLSVICGFVMAVVGYLLTEPAIRLMQTPAELEDQAGLYMKIYFCGVPASLVFNFGSSILRAHGDTKRPMMILSVSGLANVLLNLAFVLLFDMAVAAVALATVVSQVISAVWVLRVLFDPNGEFKMSFRGLRLHKEELLAIVRVGIPCGINGILFSVSNTILQSTVNTFGETVIAGNVAADGISGLVYQILIAFYTACVSFSGQCYGAKKYSRIDRLFRDSCLACSGIIVLVATAATLFPRQLMGIFNQDPAVLDAGFPKLMICCWGYILYSISENLLGCLRGMKRSGVPTVLNVVGICLPRLIWIYVFFPMNPTVMMLYLCYPISYVISITLQGSYYIYTRKKLKAQNDEVADVTPVL